MNEAVPAKIDDVVRKEALEAAADAESDFEVLQEFSIEDQQDLEFAAQELAEVKGKKKAWDDKLKGFTVPLNKMLKDIRELLNPPIKYYEKCERLWKRKIEEGYERAYDKQREALEEAAVASKEEDEEETSAALERASSHAFAPIKGLSTADIYGFEIVDFDTIPREHLVVDEGRLNGIIKSCKGNITIPGIKVIKKTSVRSRSA